jgi:hypothetical protein
MEPDKRSPEEIETDSFVTRIQTGSCDPYYMQQIIRNLEFLRGSYRYEDLKQKFQHHLELKQEAAKRKSWNGMCLLLTGIQTEASLVRKNMECGGSGVQ